MSGEFGDNYFEEEDLYEDFLYGLLNYREHLDFSAPIEGDLELRDYEDAIPSKGSDHMEIVTREQIFPVIIRLLFAAKAIPCLNVFLAELIKREALTLFSVQGLIKTLESQSPSIHESEMELFNNFFNLFRKAHTTQKITAQNITNAIVGYTQKSELQRNDFIEEWLEKFHFLVKFDNSFIVNQEIRKIRECFNNHTLEKILKVAQKTKS